jgi:hypothetical protein
MCSLVESVASIRCSPPAPTGQRRRGVAVGWTLPAGSRMILLVFRQASYGSYYLSHTSSYHNKLIISPAVAVLKSQVLQRRISLALQDRQLARSSGETQTQR